MNKKPTLFVAIKAFITHQGKVLVLRESPKNPTGTNPNKYDVVGGRMNPGEHFLDCLKREIMEETGLTVEIKNPFFTNEWRPVVKNEQWQIIGIFFKCTSEIDNVRLSHEHDDFKWIDPTTYREADLIENLHPAFEAFLSK